MSLSPGIAACPGSLAADFLACRFFREHGYAFAGNASRPLYADKTNLMVFANKDTCMYTPYDDKFDISKYLTQTLSTDIANADLVNKLTGLVQVQYDQGNADWAYGQLSFDVRVCFVLLMANVMGAGGLC